ncbi:hypothetical protein WAI453_013375 [Rhynchosporium graminicola]|uniref:Apple domain-containing protein n=1 Tax=Rhynchosporium graminicola TaxID=2792576 RepID=A0A1E1K9E7_9HELO|nr:uncharacterized protein RCO7_06604 [Rhynchosporium commune]
MKLIVGLFLGATLGSAAPQSLPRNAFEGLNERGLPQCHSDNLYRIFIDKRYSSSASAFCNTYITSTSISTVNPKATVTVIARITGATALITNVIVATKTNTIPQANPTITLTPKIKRDRDERLDKCPGKAGTYAANLISSACSCLVEPASVVSRIVTAPLMTITEKNTIILTRSTTTVQSTTTTVDVIGPPKAIETIHIPLKVTVIVPSYCTDGDFEAANGGFFTPICGFSYALSGNTLTIQHAGTFMDCAGICDSDPICPYFSFSPTATDNCLVYGAGFDGSYTPVADNSFNSGVRSA